MEEVIKRATENITSNILGVEEEQSVLTKCAVDIATIAFTAYKDKLRQKALKIADAIADFEDELKSLT